MKSGPLGACLDIRYSNLADQRVRLILPDQSPTGLERPRRWFRRRRRRRRQLSSRGRAMKGEKQMSKSVYLSSIYLGTVPIPALVACPVAAQARQAAVTI